MKNAQKIEVNAVNCTRLCCFLSFVHCPNTGQSQEEKKMIQNIELFALQLRIWERIKIWFSNHIIQHNIGIFLENIQPEKLLIVPTGKMRKPKYFPLPSLAPRVNCTLVYLFFLLFNYPRESESWPLRANSPRLPEDAVRFRVSHKHAHTRHHTSLYIVRSATDKWK